MVNSRKTRQSRKNSGCRLKTLLSDKDFWRPVLIALAILAAVILGIISIPKLLALPLPQNNEDSYAKYRALYTEAAEYNYAHGGSPELERKISKALELGDGNTGGYYFYLMAAAEYYYGTRDYERALDFAIAAEYNAPSDSEYEDVLLFYIKAYRRLGNTERADYYQTVYDEFTYEPEKCEEDETETAE